MFYSKPYLEQRIKEEKFRSYRTGFHFSVVFLYPFQLACDGYKSRKRLINVLTKVLEEESRETDVKGWWNRSTLAILLLDTSDEEALLFIDKLFSRLLENGYDRAESSRKAPFEIFTYPNYHRLRNLGEDNSNETNSKETGNESSHDKHNPASITDLKDHGSSNGSLPISYRELVKRILDIILSALGLIVVFPLFLVCAVLVKLGSPGPILFRQKRIGYGGNCFEFLKFRSMHHNADEEIHKNHVKNLMNGKAGLTPDGSSGETTYKLAEDGRVTRFGKFLRKTSIDELPQLINVLKGDMTFIGPRPHPVYECEHYALWQNHRLEVKPGITGLGQVYGRFNKGYKDVYRLDLQYLKKSNLILDLKILIKTILVVLSGRGAR